MGAVTIATNMAGRGTDILLAATPTCWPTTQLRERGSIRTPNLTEDGEPNPALPTDEQRGRWPRRSVCAEEHDQAIAAGGGLTGRHGTERHESRRTTISCAAVPAVRATPA